MSKIKLLHIIKSLSIGGIENLMLDFCLHAHKHDIESHVICIGGGELETTFKALPIHFNVFKKISRPYDIIDPILIWRLRNYIKKNQINVVYTHFADEGLHALAAIVGLKNVVFAQEMPVDLSTNRKIDNKKFKFIGRYANILIAPSQTTKTQILNYKIGSKNNVHFIHNGIDPLRIKSKDENLKCVLMLPDDTIVGGMIGNFYNNIRDQLTVCKALPEVMKKHPQFHFIFAGGHKNKWIKQNNTYFDTCVKFCKENGIIDRVHFIGLTKNPSEVYNTLNFYVHATNYDTFGIAPVEAMFNHLPVIANNAPVFIETSFKGKGMWLFEDKNAADLSLKINYFIENPEQIKVIGEKHYQHAQEHFHIDVYIKNMKTLFFKLLEK